MTRLLVLGLTAGLVSGCANAASALDPRGPRSAHVAELWWIMLGLGGVISAVVTALILIAILRNRAHTEEPPRPLAADPADTASGQRWVLYGGVVMPAIVLVGLTFFTIRTTNAIATAPSPPAFTIEVVGHMWWWQVRYPDHGFETANEIHVPVGQTVELKLVSADVIHSFWVPQVEGKLDLIPGRTNTTWIRVDTPGFYRGPCAEYCGVQHAHMVLHVIAQPQDEFDAWIAQQQQPAVQPADATALRGAQVFSQARCIECHAIRYGDRKIGGDEGPDLTHVALRRTLAAGMIPNTKGNMAGWIANPQAIKPGNKMPVIPLESGELHALVAYMESLR